LRSLATVLPIMMLFLPPALTRNRRAAGPRPIRNLNIVCAGAPHLPRGCSRAGQARLGGGGGAVLQGAAEGQRRVSPQRMPKAGSALPPACLPPEMRIHCPKQAVCTFGWPQAEEPRKRNARDLVLQRNDASPGSE